LKGDPSRQYYGKFGNLEQLLDGFGEWGPKKGKPKTTFRVAI
jgi:hypothetical protein